MAAARGINQLLKRTLHNQSAARRLKVGDKPLLTVSIFMQWEALALLLTGISVNKLKSLPEGSSALGLPVAAGAYQYTLFLLQNRRGALAVSGLQHNPMLNVPGAPLGSTMIPMVLPDGRLVYIPQPAGQQPVPMTSPPPQKGGRHNGGSSGGGSSSGRRRKRGDESGSSNNSRRGRHRPY